MTVASETSRSGPYNGNGSTTVFAYGFRILDEDHLTVISRSAAGVETTLTIGTHYTVSGVGSPSGGNVTMLTAPVSGSTLTILRNVPFTQEIDLENQGAYYAESVEAGFDAAVMRDQQLGERIDRAVLLPASSNIADLDALVADITRLADSADEIDTVSTNISSVVTVAPHAADITTNLADIVTVADNIADVVTVADNISSVNDVAPHAAAITTNLADITNFADVYLGAKATDPALRNDGTALQAGDMYFNTTVDLMKAYSGSAWVSASDVVLNVVAKAFTGNGVLTTFTLDVDPGTVNNLFVDIGGVPQRPGVDYTISGTTLTISPAVSNGVPIFTRVLFSVSNIAVPADASVTAAKLDASLTATLAGKMDKAGGAFTGPVTVAADPTVALGVATKQYADAKNALQSIAASVAANALTVNFTAQGQVSFRNPTLTNGAPVSATPSNLSLVVPSGATLGTTNAVQSQIALILLYNGGTPALGVVNLTGGVNLDETSLISTTAISAGSTSASTVYSTSAITNSPFRVVGYVTSTQATAGTWASAPSLVQGAGGNAMAAMQSIGFGQTWQTVTRVSGTTYYNTTSRPIMAQCNLTTSANNVTATVVAVINGTASITVASAGGGAVPQTLTSGSFIIPPGASYVYTITNATVTFNELR